MLVLFDHKNGCHEIKLVHFMRKCFYSIGEKFDMTNLVGFPHFIGQSYLISMGVVRGVATLHDQMVLHGYTSHV